MPVQLTLPDGTRCWGVRHYSSDWLMIDQPLKTGERFQLDGIERVVSTVVRTSASLEAVRFLPDFERPECGPCGASAEPPSAEVCMSRSGCPLRQEVGDLV